MRFILGLVLLMNGYVGGLAAGETARGESSADPAAIVVAGEARFTVLTPALLRLEWSPSGDFEDRASFAFVNRRMPVPEFTSRREDGWLILATGEVTLRYKEGSGRFGPENLQIALEVAGNPVTWKPGDAPAGNLRGTTRTLDGVSGPCPLEEGLLSRDGWSVVDDSERLLFDDETGWATARPDQEAIDWYFFGYGRDYARLLGDFIQVAGRIPLPPRYAFGTWWSRYWAYTDDELKALVEEFDSHDVPLDVLVVDMDWHLDGWTGYTWNPEYFPDPAEFLWWVKERGLQATLNLHPHSGVGKHEAAFPAMAKELGLDPAKIESIPFDCADPAYMAAYFKHLHHPLERMGIDFWWMDWQQGEASEIPGLDPLFWLNHLHWRDMAENPERSDKRPLVFSRWGGLGNHRYQVGFSGDAFCNWPSLAFQPYFTATAGNVGYAYWSHDIGGHQPGPVDPELYTRWVQFGALSPILRTHTTKNAAAERRIWKFPEPYFEAMRSAINLRYELLPYIYTMARKCYDTGMPLCRPLYYAWPELDEAYDQPGTYLFGDDLLVAPVTAHSNGSGGLTNVSVYLPPGTWMHWFTGAHYDGPGPVTVAAPLDEIPLFVRAGAIVPTTASQERTAAMVDQSIALNIFPGPAAATRLYEDDGLAKDYATQHRWTPVKTETVAGGIAVTIGPAEGDYAGAAVDRAYELRLWDVYPAAAALRVTVGDTVLDRVDEANRVGWRFDDEAMCLVVRLPRMAVAEAVRVELAGLAGSDEQPWSNGLRGALRTLDRVVAVLGEKDLPAWVRPQALRAEIAKLDDPQKAAESVGRAWDRYLRLVGELDASTPKATAAMTQLLGAAVRVSTAPSLASPGDVELSVDVTVAPPVVARTTPTWGGRVRYRPLHGWEINRRQEWRSAKLALGESFRLTALLRPVGEPQTVPVGGEIVVNWGANELTAAFERTLLPSINRWWIVGPFDAPQDDRLQRVFPPEEKLDLAARYVGQEDEEIGWQRVERTLDAAAATDEEFFVEFHKVFDRYCFSAVAYAVTYLRSPEEMDAVLAIGSDDGLVVWLNGEEVHRHDVGRAFTSKEDGVAIHLREGVNTLMVKISQGGGMWGFAAHLETPDGKLIPGLAIHLDDAP